MEAYTSFAEVYDTFMDNVPYEEWAEYLAELLQEYDIEDGLVLDLGCGTGSLTEILATKGYDMIGADGSAEMLEIAMEKKAQSGHDILYLLQDMREFELYGTVRAVVSVCDCVNYITDEKELEQVFRLVNNYLDPAGIFIFDFNTEYKYKEILGEQTIAEDREDCSFIWDNYYDEEEAINELALSLFVKEPSDSDDNLFRKYEELHVQKGYTLKQMKQMVADSGLTLLAAYDAFTHEPADEECERIYIIAKETRNKNSKKQYIL